MTKCLKCDKPRVGKGLCRTHYQRRYRGLKDKATKTERVEAELPKSLYRKLSVYAERNQQTHGSILAKALAMFLGWEAA